MQPQLYRPHGPQVNISLARVLTGGWKICYKGSHAEIDAIIDTDVQDIEDSKCRGSNIMMACGRDNNSDVPATLQLLAWAPREVVFNHTSDKGEVSMGTRFYRTWTSYPWTSSRYGVWGFNGGNTTDRGQTGGACDNQTEDAQIRLCWQPSALSYTLSGWRCGEIQSLSRKPQWKRIIFESD